MANPASRIVKTESIKSVVLQGNVSMTKINILHISQQVGTETLQVLYQLQACLPSAIAQSWNNSMQSSLYRHFVE